MGKKMNILLDYSQASYANSKKGNFIHSYFLSKNISKSNNIFSLKFVDNPKIISKETGIKHSSNLFLRVFPTSLNSLIQLLSTLIKRKKIDLVYSRYTPSLFKQWGTLYSIMKKKPIIYEVGGIPWEEFPSKKFSNKLYMKLILYPLKRANHIVCYSNSIKDSLLKEMELDGEKISIIPCGVDPKVFIPKNKKTLIKKYGLPENKKIITFAGVVQDWQGLDILIDSIKNIISTRKDFLFLIAGGGDYLEDFKDKVKSSGFGKYFYFTDYVEQKKIVDYINMADFCIAPFIKSRKASPIKIFEYLSCNKFVLSSDIKDVKDLGLDDNIEYFKSENPVDFSQKILQIMNKDKIIITGRKSISKKYTWEKISNDVEKTIRSILENERKNKKDNR